MNPLGTGKPTVNPMLQNLANTLRYAQSFQSPDAFMQYLHRENPQMAQYLMYLAQTLKNPSQTALQALAQQGITPEQLQAAMGQK